MFADPEKNIERFGLEPGHTVADIGTGSGYYAIAAGKAVGPKGHVYAVDIIKDMLLKLKKEAEQSHLRNISVVWGNAERVGGTTLKDSFIDRAVVSNILFQLDSRDQIAQEVKRILKPGGKVLVVDWTDSFGMLGPSPESVVTAKAARDLFEKGGLTFEREFNAGSHHYGLVFKK